MRCPVALALFLSSLLTTGAAQSHDARFKDLLQTSSFKRPTGSSTQITIDSCGNSSH